LEETKIQETIKEIRIIARCKHRIKVNGEDIMDINEIIELKNISKFLS
jgi:hypothetical protein